jgi:NADPH-dependent 2,4-dienoyl-CoA reductase/sulfur reductase-like enzyme
VTGAAAMKNNVYWWQAAPLTELPQKPVAPASDVVIVGAGYTGLGAAITLARAGRSV